MNSPKEADIAKMLRQIALREGVPVEEVRKQIKIAMLAGLHSQDLQVQACWKRIPCKGDIPTPEELIVFLVTEARRRDG